MLLATRDGSDTDDDAPSPEEVQLVERIRGERARRRRGRRGLALVVVVALLVIGAALLTAPRHTARVADDVAPSADSTGRDAASSDTAASSPAERRASTENAPETARPAADSPPQTTATPAPPATVNRDAATSTSAPDATAPAREVTLPPRAARIARERGDGDVGRARTMPRSTPAEDAAQSSAPPARAGVQNEPAALAGTAAARPPDVRVDVKQVPGGAPAPGAPRTMDYTVRLSNAGGGPVADADVRLRGLTVDGVLVEAQLDPGGEPGVYRGLVPVTPRGPNNLTVRVVRPDGVVEVPVGGTQLTR